MVHVLNHKIRHEIMLQRVPSPAWCLSLAEQYPLPDLAKASLKEKLQAFRTVADGRLDVNLRPLSAPLEVSAAERAIHR